MWICPNIILSVIIVVILKCYVSQQTPNFLINFTIMNHIFNNEYLNIPSLTGSYYFTQTFTKVSYKCVSSSEKFIERNLMSTLKHKFMITFKSYHCT